MRLIHLSILLSWIWLGSFPLFSQTKNEGISTKVTHMGWNNIDYVGDGLEGHLLDIALPNNGEGPFPAIVAIYGSAWFSNSSKGNVFESGVGSVLLENGFAVISINHRSSHSAKFPAQIQDVKAAIRFIRGNAQKYNLDPAFIGITGWSSGGHLSAMAGTTTAKKKHQLKGQKIDLEGSLGEFTSYSSDVDAVVDWFGPTDFLIMDECGSSFSHNEAKSPESTLVGGEIQLHKTKVRLANPITYIRKSNPPFLIFHGDDDPLVPHCQSEKLFEALQQKKVESELIIIKGGKHGPGVMIDTYFEQMVGFFKKSLQENRNR